MVADNRDWYVNRANEALGFKIDTTTGLVVNTSIVIFANATDGTGGIVLRSPDGSLWRVVAANGTGNISGVAYP